jgi:hypothetical protein
VTVVGADAPDAMGPAGSSCPKVAFFLQAWQTGAVETTVTQKDQSPGCTYNGLFVRVVCPPDGCYYVGFGLN